MPPQPPALIEPTPDTLMWQQGLSRLSPGTLYGEAVVAMLNPDAQSMTTLLAQFQGRVASPLPLDQSLVQAWPQIVSLIAGTILLYVIGYEEFTTTALNINALTLQTFETFTVLAVVYLTIVWTLSGLIRLLEARLALPEDR